MMKTNMLVILIFHRIIIIFFFCHISSHRDDKKVKRNMFCDVGDEKRSETCHMEFQQRNFHNRTNEI